MVLAFGCGDGQRVPRVSPCGGRGFVILPCKEGVVSGQDIDENYRLVSNDACPEGMSSLSFF